MPPVVGAYIVFIFRRLDDAVAFTASSVVQGKESRH